MQKIFLYINIIFLLASCSKKIAYNHTEDFTEQEDSNYTKQKIEKMVATHLATLGKAVEEYKNKQSWRETTFKDSLIEVRYDYQDSKFVNIIAFRDTICFVEIISEHFKITPNTVDTVISDNHFEGCKNYFKKMYQTNLDISTLPKSIFDIRGDFGIAVGAAGTPTEYGKIYLDLKEKGVNSEEVLKLMTSLNPYQQLNGYLLYDEEKHQISKSVIDLVEKSTYKINYRYGCSPYYPPVTILDVKKIMKEY
ncbi:hypothetical protein ACE193_07960 [Bernardetia sp. OM2101]|uniref:hypothetical protein n=1 Tax=Bernardetia sp. OM2101 TaxID=3344876 RepID=UPI0035D0ABB1